MWWRPVKRIWCSECTGLGHTEQKRRGKQKNKQRRMGKKDHVTVLDGNRKRVDIRKRERKRETRC